MSYTFGGATADDIVVTGLLSVGATATMTLHAGWFYPTTLTSTRGLYSCGNTYGVEINSTTDELRIRTDNTTDGQWTTTGADIVVNEWVFIATAVHSHNTGPTVAVRCWVGRQDTPPAEVTVTSATAPVGNNTGAATRYVGNKGTGTLAFQGTIGWLSVIYSGVASNLTGVFGCNTNGVIDNAEAALILERWVYPLWLGKPRIRNHGLGTADFSVQHFPLDRSGCVYQYASGDSAGVATLTPTINGATYSELAPPRRPPNNWMRCVDPYVV